MSIKRLKIHYLVSAIAALVGMGLALVPGFINGLHRVHGATNYEITPFQTTLGAGGFVLLAAGGVWLLVTRTRMWLRRVVVHPWTTGTHS